MADATGGKICIFGIAYDICKAFEHGQAQVDTYLFYGDKISYFAQACTCIDVDIDLVLAFIKLFIFRISYLSFSGK